VFYTRNQARSVGWWLSTSSRISNIPMFVPSPSMFDCTRNQGIELKDDSHGPIPSIKTCDFCDASQERGFAVVFEVRILF
jgi:hypothetical protein